MPGVVALALLTTLVLITEPWSVRREARLRGDKDAAALRAQVAGPMDALKAGLPHADDARWGEVWLADGVLVCGYVLAKTEAGEDTAWQMFAGQGGTVHRQGDTGPEARAWRRRCQTGRLRLVFPGSPGPTLR